MSNVRNNMVDEDKMIEENIGLVLIYVRKMKPMRVVDFDDFLQAGLIGLLKAARAYDPSYNTKFSTYAVPKIKNEIFTEAKKFSDSGYSQLKIEPEKVEKETILEYLPDLDDESIHIILMRASGNTLQEIADKYGKTKEWARLKVNAIADRIVNANQE